jgi:hypothetical protein
LGGQQKWLIKPLPASKGSFYEESSAPRLFVFAAGKKEGAHVDLCPRTRSATYRESNTQPLHNKHEVNKKFSTSLIKKQFKSDINNPCYRIRTIDQSNYKIILRIHFKPSFPSSPLSICIIK